MADDNHTLNSPRPQDLVEAHSTNVPDHAARIRPAYYTPSCRGFGSGIPPHRPGWSGAMRKAFAIRVGVQQSQGRLKAGCIRTPHLGHELGHGGIFRYFIRRASATILSRVAFDICGLFLSASDTAFFETPAAAATSAIVGVFSTSILYCQESAGLYEPKTPAMIAHTYAFLPRH